MHDGRDRSARISLAQAVIGAGISALAWGCGWPIVGMVAAAFAFGMATVSVRVAYLASAESAGSPPRWLSFLESVRRGLAFEPDA